VSGNGKPSNPSYLFVLFSFGFISFVYSLLGSLKFYLEILFQTFSFRIWFLVFQTKSTLLHSFVRQNIFSFNSLQNQNKPMYAYAQLSCFHQPFRLVHLKEYRIYCLPSCSLTVISFFVINSLSVDASNSNLYRDFRRYFLEKSIKHRIIIGGKARTWATACYFKWGGAKKKNFS